MRDYSDVTDTEIRIMPFWKRLCFEVQPWNRSFNPTDINEWVVTFSVFHPNVEDAAKLIRKAVELHEEDQ